MGTWQAGELTICQENSKFLNILSKCLKSTSNVLKDLPESKTFKFSQTFARFQSLNVWIIFLAHANCLFFFFFFFFCHKCFIGFAAYFTTNLGPDFDKKIICLFISNPYIILKKLFS